MTKEQKRLLAPHAKHFADMVAFIVTRDRDELAALQSACEAATESNCSWDIYRAARYMLREIETEQYQRLKNRAAAAETNGAETA